MMSASLNKKHLFVVVTKELILARGYLFAAGW